MQWFTQPMLDRLNERTGQHFTAALFVDEWEYIRCMFELNTDVILLKTDHGLMLGIYEGDPHADQTTAKDTAAVSYTSALLQKEVVPTSN